jgi:hypothetical protein
MDRDKMSNLYRGPSIDASYEVSLHLAEGFRRRRLSNPFVVIMNNKISLNHLKRCEKGEGTLVNIKFRYNIWQIEHTPKTILKHVCVA